jgi:hypothetical protein
VDDKPGVDDIMYLVQRLTSSIETLSDTAKELSRNFAEFNSELRRLMALTATERATGQLMGGLLRLISRRPPNADIER